MNQIFSGATFDDTPKPRANPRSRKSPPKAASEMLQALQFVALASDPDAKALWPQYARIVNNWILAGNGTMRAGHPIADELTLCPHIARMADAIGKAGSAIAMTPLDNGRLSIAGAKFKGIVPCLKGEDMPPIMGDPPIAPINDKIKDGFRAVLSLAREEAESIVESSVLLRANTVVATNRNLIFEFWHGVDLPPALVVPQAFAKAVTKIAKPLIGFGWTQGRSITFHFEGGGWIATQLREGEWPDVDRVLNVPVNLSPCPSDLFEALDAILPFSVDGAVHFHDGKLKSSFASMAEGEAVYGATHDVPELKGGHHFSGKLLKLAKPAAAQIDYTTHEDRMVMYNQEAWLRGVLMKRLA